MRTLQVLVLRHVLPFVLAAGALAAMSREAAAYPQFQFSSGTQRCGQCHYSPTGYGLLTAWGRDESADTISMAGGDGSFLHGAATLPAWLSLGGDFRGTVLRNTTQDDSPGDFAIFPMQAEIYARAAFGETGLSLYVTGGVRGAARGEGSWPASSVESFISREHYLMWKPSGTGPYARVGRYYAPFGLRLAEHVYFIRRYTGFNLYEETYTASGGYLAEDWEAHVSAFAPPPSGLPSAFQSVGMRPIGAAAYAEKHFASMAAAGAQARFARNEEQSLIQVGVVGKYWLEKAKMLALAEVDFHNRAIANTNVAVRQLVSYVGAHFFPIKGVMAGLAFERYHEDLRVASLARNAWDIQLHLFPWAHFELMLFGRYQFTGKGNSDGAPATTAMLQLHYYL